MVFFKYFMLCVQQNEILNDKTDQEGGNRMREFPGA